MPQTRAGLAVTAPLVCAALFFAPLTASAQAQQPPAGAQQPPCMENEQNIEPSSTDEQNLIELQPNAARPTFEVGLTDKPSGDDKIYFTPKGGRRIGHDAMLAAEVTDPPRSGSQPLDGKLFVAAHGTPSGRTAVVEVCFKDHSPFKAGRYQGTIAVYGPKLTDFSYALVVTTKWPWWSAAGLIAIALLGFALIAVISDFSGSGKKKGNLTYWAGLVFGIVIGVVLGALTYFTIYNKNATWGDDPGTQITALAIATFTAATGGLLAGRRLLPTQAAGEAKPDVDKGQAAPTQPAGEAKPKSRQRPSRPPPEE